MEFFLLILLLIAIIGLSNIIYHFVPFIPVPLIQIALGAIIAAGPSGIELELDPELFFILFIAPLLFHDGKKASRKALWELRKPILLLALGLVFITVFVIGYLIHWLIPSIPLPAAFALAAILSPTDVVAVGAIASRVKIPSRIMHILEGEGLMNDASGLVAFKFAVAATVTGVFSLAEASWSFVVIALGGFIGGAILSFAIIRLRRYIRRHGMEDVMIHMIIQILTPFVIYYIIEHLHFSGILSVVAAGIVHSFFSEREQTPSLQLHLVSNNTWNVLIYLLNGLVFVLLGLQIPAVAREIIEDPMFNNIEVFIYILIITAALLLLRFLWLNAVWFGGWFFNNRDFQKPNFREISITTVSGVRGAVTLAGAFTIPFVIANGGPFPERSLIIFIAAGVILVTLVTASIVLPLIAKTDKIDTELLKEKAKKDALLRTIEAAIEHVRKNMTVENRAAALAIIANYNRTRNRLKNDYEEDEISSNRLKSKEIEIRMMALNAEAKYLQKLKEEGNISQEYALLTEEHIQRMRLAVTNRFQYRSSVFWKIVKRSYYQINQLLSPNKNELQQQHKLKLKKLAKVKVAMAKEAVRVLKENKTSEYEELYLSIIGEYNEMIVKFNVAEKGIDSTNFNRILRELQDEAFQAERNEIQALYENGEVSMEIASSIRKQINIREAYWMEENSLHS